MKALFHAVLAVVFVSNAAVAEVAEQDVLRTLDVTISDVQVTSDAGQVLKQRMTFPRASFLVGVPVKVSRGSVCIDIAGQEIKKDVQTRAGIYDQVIVRGSQNPLVDACIQIFPMPIDTMVTVPVEVNTMTPVAQASKSVMIGGGFYRLTIDLHSMAVSIEPIDISHF